MSAFIPEDNSLLSLGKTTITAGYTDVVLVECEFLQEQSAHYQPRWTKQLRVPDYFTLGRRERETELK